MAEETKPTEENKTEPESKDTMVPKSDLDEMKDSLKTYKEESEARMESLQDSLDSAMEDLALKGNKPEADDLDDDDFDLPEKLEDAIEAINPDKESEKPEEESKKEIEEEDSDIEKELGNAISEEKEFREGILMREELRDMREDIGDAVKDFPSADKSEVLLGVEDGIYEDDPDQITKLAEDSHNRRVSEKEETKKSLTEDIKAQLSKESEGDKSVPQSGGFSKSSQTPEKEEEEGGLDKPWDYDKDWDTALKAAKSEGGEE